MNSTFLSVGGLLVGLALVLTALFRRLAPAANAVRLPDPAWLETFRPSRYRPMTRLLQDADFEFLASQPGYEPALARALRSARRLAFRRYLRLLRRDFDRLYVVAKLLVVHSAEDRSDLAAALFQQRIRFVWALTVVEFRLAFHWTGVSQGDVRGILDALEALTAQVRQVAPAPAAA